MDFFDVIRVRQSIRKFQPRKIEPEVLDELLKAIRTTPTAGNLQSYQVFLTESVDKIKALAAASYGQSCVSEAPAVLIFCTDAPRAADYGERGRTLYCVQDATIAATIAHLAAAALGLGSVMVGAFKTAEVAKAIDAPAHLVPIMMLPIGHPNETPSRTRRRSLEDLIIRL